MFTCPHCKGIARVIRSRRDRNGRRLRRWSCEGCHTRWTTYGDQLPPRTRMRGLSEEAIFDILTSSESNAALRQRWHCSQRCINLTRIGAINASVLPELRRWGKNQNCKRCCHWAHSARACRLGIKGAIERSVLYARECLKYEPISRPIAAIRSKPPTC